MTRQHWETIWSFKTRNFTVTYSVTEEYDLDLSWDDDGLTREGLESGKYVAFVSRVTCECDGVELASDYLGGCIYESATAFIDHRGNGYRSGIGSYFADMVRSVCADAREKLREIQATRVRSIAPAT